MHSLNLKTAIFTAFALSTCATTQGDPLDVWTPCPAPTQSPLNAITFGGGQFVAVGDRLVIRSPDGVNWIRAASNFDSYPDDPNFESVAYGEERFVAIGIVPLDGPFPFTSSDGINWLDDTNDLPTYPFLGAITFADGRFVSGGHGIAFGGGLFVCLGRQGPSFDDVDTSVDGITWASHHSGINSYGGWDQALAYGKGQFVSVTQNVGTSVIASSSDGTNWLPRLVVTNQAFFAVTFASGQFVAVGGNDDLTPGPPIYSSADGINWIKRKSVTNISDTLSGIAYGNGRFVAVGGTTILVSGAPFTQLDLERVHPTQSLRLSLRAPVGLVCSIQSSSDLTSWQDITNITSVQPTNIITDINPATTSRLFFRAYTQ